MSDKTLTEMQPAPDPWMTEVTRRLAALWAEHGANHTMAVGENYDKGMHEHEIVGPGEVWTLSPRPWIIDHLLSQNRDLRDTIDMHVADLAALRAKNEALQRA